MSFREIGEDEKLGLRDSDFDLSIGNISNVDDVNINVDEEWDHVIIQDNYIESCLFCPLPAPNWKYSDPPASLLMRGLTKETLREEVNEINKISKISFKKEDNIILRLLPILPLLSLLVGFIFILISIINNPTPNIQYITIGGAIFAVGLLLAMISCYFGYQNRENALNKAIKSVIDHVENTLNQKYKENLIELKVIEHKSITSFQEGLPNRTREDGMDNNDNPKDPDYDKDDEMIKDFTYYNICFRAIIIDTNLKSKVLSNKLLSVEDDDE